jgi:hypothetical protein
MEGVAVELECVDGALLGHEGHDGEPPQLARLNAAQERGERRGWLSFRYVACDDSLKSASSCMGHLIETSLGTYHSLITPGDKGIIVAPRAGSRHIVLRR